MSEADFQKNRRKRKILKISALVRASEKGCRVPRGRLGAAQRRSDIVTALVADAKLGLLLIPAAQGVDTNER
jgi:hypothetical protein